MAAERRREGGFAESEGELLRGSSESHRGSLISCLRSQFFWELQFDYKEITEKESGCR